MDADVELRRELPEGLHRRLSLVGLEPRDISVRDAGSGKGALREAELLPAVAEPLTDGRGAGVEASDPRILACSVKADVA